MTDSLTSEDMRARLEDLVDQLKIVADSEDGPTFMGWPDRWWDEAHWRCTEGHVSTIVLRSEDLGRDACIAGRCRARTTLTFPEDRDGPLKHSALVSA